MALPRRTASRPQRHRGQKPVTFRHVLSNAADITLGAKLAALTAAAVRVDASNATQMRRLVQPWQILTLAYYDQVGENWASGNFYGRNLKKVRLFAAERKGDGEIVPTDNPEATAIVERIQDPGGGGYSQLLESYGRLRFLIGEGYWLITNPDGDDERWEFVSPDELRINGGQGTDAYTRFTSPSLPAEQLEDIPDENFSPLGSQALVYRSWRPHPRFSKLADSAVRAQLKTLEELQLLSLAIGATAKNRMATNGILFLPDDLDEMPIDATAEEAANHSEFLRNMTEQLVAGIVNPGSAAAASPVMVMGPAEVAEAIKWIQISDPSQSYPEEGIRTELIRRYAVGVDLPASALTGVEDLNHWTGWLVDEQGARDYIYPACDDLVGELTSVFMRPILRDAGVPNWDSFVFGYDAAAVIAHPNQAQDAKDAHDRIVISDARLREALNFNDGDAPDEEEWQRRAALKLLDPSALTDPYEVEPAPVDEDEQQEGEESAPEGNDSTEQAVPDTKPQDAADGDVALRAQLLGACRLSVVRAREMAGARLRSALVTQPGEVRDEHKDVPNHELPARLGAAWVREHSGRTEVQLIDGATRPLLVALHDIGISEPAAQRISQLVATHAAQTLYSSQLAPLPRGLVALLENHPVRQAA